MRHRVARLMHRFQRQRAAVLGLISSFLLPLTTNIISSVLSLAVHESLPAIVQILAVIIGLLVALRVLYVVLGRRNVPLSHPSAALPAYPGLIVLVGRRPPADDPFKSSAVPAIEHHLASTDQSRRLRVCWLIATQGDAGSAPVANKLYDRYKDRCQVLIRHVTDPFSVQEAYFAVRDVYAIESERHSLPPTDIISDFTGGTQPMAAGMVLACGDEWPMQYMIKANGDSKPIFVQFNRRG